jgi:acetyltransferase-like isoleucine patch superfamily enzyme
VDGLIGSPKQWSKGELPFNVQLGEGSRIIGAQAFKRFFSQTPNGLRLDDHSSAVEVSFAVGPDGRISVGKYCYLNDCVLLSEHEIRIGNYVMIGWGTTVSDADFHPLEPAERIRDAMALAPLSKGSVRQELQARAVIIGDDVFVGPACTILKGVTIGEGAFVEPGSVVTRNVAPHARVRGNPASVVEEGDGI